jgi:hypothetical protein
MQINTRKHTLTLTNREVQTMKDAAEIVRNMLVQTFVEHPRGEGVAEVLDDLARIYGGRKETT